MDLTRTDLAIGETEMLKAGRPLSFSEEKVSEALKRESVPLTIDLGLGDGSATAWGCDMSEAYVAINSHYMT